MFREAERKKILVVDDELDMRIFLCNLLGTCGYEAIDAGGRIEGLQKVREAKPALIILDIMLPRERGIQLYRDLRRDDELREVPVIIVWTIDKKTFSAYQKLKSPAHGQEVPEPGAYLEKPLEADELIRLVRELIRAAECRAPDAL
ncbi:MAG: response regulator [Desulfobacterales bacterium]|nr:MAG: response regulator [Desulfobacterales bacterium]